MRVCPKCGHLDPQYWRRSFQRNPGGEIDIARLEDIAQDDKELAEKISKNLGSVIEQPPFAYLLGKKAIYVKRIWLELYKMGGISAFSIPYELKPRLRGQKKLLE